MEDLNLLGIKDRTTFIMSVGQVNVKHKLILTSQHRIQAVQYSVNDFKNRFLEASSLGLPIPWTEDGWSISRECYEKELEKERSNHEQFQDVKGPIKGKIIYEKLFKYFLLLCTLMKIQRSLPPANFDLFTQLDIATRKMIATKIPDGVEWKHIEKLRNKRPLLTIQASTQMMTSTSTPHVNNNFGISTSTVYISSSFHINTHYLMNLFLCQAYLLQLPQHKIQHNMGQISQKRRRMFNTFSKNHYDSCPKKMGIHFHHYFYLGKWLKQLNKKQLSKEYKEKN
jgi:hypothetical protein